MLYKRGRVTFFVSPSNGESMSPPSKRPRSDPSVELDKIIGSHLSLLLDENAVEQVKTNAQAAPGMSNYETEAVRNFLIRSKGMFHHVNLISFRYHDPHVIKTYGPKNSGREVKTEVFDHLNDCYGNVCKDYVGWCSLTTRRTTRSLPRIIYIHSPTSPSPPSIYC